MADVNGGLTPWHVGMRYAMAESDPDCTRAACSLEPGAKLCKHAQGPFSPAGLGRMLAKARWAIRAIMEACSWR